MSTQPIATDGRQTTALLLNVAGVMERAEEQVLPALFKYVGLAYAATPSQLGTLTFCRAIVQAVSSPFSGMLGDWIDRTLIVGTGALWWGAITVLIAGNSSYGAAMFLWACNGIGLAAIIPASQSLLADYYPSHARGEAFGFLYMTGGLGALIAGLFATNIGGVDIGGLDGWRFAFLLTGVISFLVGLMVLQFATDPRRADLLDAAGVLAYLCRASRTLRRGLLAGLRRVLGLTGLLWVGQKIKAVKEGRRGRGGWQRVPADVATPAGTGDPESGAGGAGGADLHGGDGLESEPVPPKPVQVRPGGHGSLSGPSSAGDPVSRARALERRSLTRPSGQAGQGQAQGQHSNSIHGIPPARAGRSSNPSGQAAAAAAAAVRHAGSGSGGVKGVHRASSRSRDRAAASAAAPPSGVPGYSLDSPHAAAGSGSAAAGPSSGHPHAPHVHLAGAHVGAHEHEAHEAPHDRSDRDVVSLPLMVGQGKTLIVSGAAKPKLSWTDVKWLMGLPTFQIIVLQGIVGSTPWNGMVFFTLYLQLLGMTDGAASIVMATFLLGAALGGLLGGYIGDAMASRWPNHGRIFAAQCTVFSGLPLSAIFLRGLPRENVHEPKAFWSYVIVALIFGLLISWAASACNSPMFSDIVPDYMRSTVYAYDRCFESALAACAAPLVGLMAERVFGFKGDLKEASQAGPDFQRFRLHNADALSKALLYCLEVPWALCLVFYSGLHWTYKRDKAQMVRHLLEQATHAIEMSPSTSVFTTRNPSPHPTIDPGSHHVQVHRLDISERPGGKEEPGSLHVGKEGRGRRGVEEPAAAAAGAEGEEERTVVTLALDSGSLATLSLPPDEKGPRTRKESQTDSPVSAVKRI